MLPHDTATDPKHESKVQPVLTKLEKDKKAGKQEQKTTDVVSLAHLSQEQLGQVATDKSANSQIKAAVKEEDIGDKPNWLSERWTDRGNGIIGPHDVDDSMRCQKSRLCEGLESCKLGESLMLRLLLSISHAHECLIWSWSWHHWLILTDYSVLRFLSLTACQNCNGPTWDYAWLVWQA